MAQSPKKEKARIPPREIVSFTEDDVAQLLAAGDFVKIKASKEVWRFYEKDLLPRQFELADGKPGTFRTIIGKGMVKAWLSAIEEVSKTKNVSKYRISYRTLLEEGGAGRYFGGHNDPSNYRALMMSGADDSFLNVAQSPLVWIHAIKLAMRWYEQFVLLRGFEESELTGVEVAMLVEDHQMISQNPSLLTASLEERWDAIQPSFAGTLDASYREVFLTCCDRWEAVFRTLLVELKNHELRIKKRLLDS